MDTLKQKDLLQTEAQVSDELSIEDLEMIAGGGWAKTTAQVGFGALGTGIGIVVGGSVGNVPGAVGGGIVGGAVGVGVGTYVGNKIEKG